MIFGGIIMLSIMGGANYYVARRLYQWLNLLFPQLNVIIFIGIYVFLAVAMILGLLPLPATIKSGVSWIGVLFYGFFIYLLIFTLAADLIVLIGVLTKIIPSPISHIVLFCKGLMVVLLSVGIVSYGLYNANQIKRVSYEVQIKGADLGNLKIALISDLHLGTTINESNLAKVIQEVNDLEPDIVCIAGDIFNDDFNAIRDPAKMSGLFKSIKATYGVYACSGNHDGGSTFDEMVSFLEQCDVRLLNDEHVIIDDRLALFGRMDASPIGGFGGRERQDISDVIAAMGASMPVIVMEHNPSHINEYGGEVLLILAGHSHRGQIFPGSLITRAVFDVDYGYYQKDENSPNVIVSSGAGVWGPPLRVGTNNEIVIINLR